MFSLSKKPFHAFLLLFLFSSSFAFSQIKFQKTIGGPGDERIQSFSIAPDSSYILAGYTTSFGATQGDLIYCKLDINGNVLWFKTIKATGNEFMQSIIPTADGGYAITGESNSYGSGDFNAILVKTDLSGNVEWSKIYGTPGDERALKLIQTSDKGYLIVSHTNNFNGSLDIYLVKTDSLGLILWTKVIGGSADENASSILETSDKGILIGGYTYSYGSGGDIYIIKLDSVGNFLWDKVFGSSGPEQIFFTREILGNSDLIITGVTSSFGSLDPLLIKLDSQGNIIWSKRYDNSLQDIAYSFHVNEKNECAILGIHRTGAGDMNIFVLKTDSAGTIQWSKSYGGSDEDLSGVNIEQTYDKGYFISGQTKSSGAGLSDIYLIKTDSLGNSGCNDNDISWNSFIWSPNITTGIDTNSGGSSQDVFPIVNNIIPIVNDPCCILPEPSFTAINGCPGESINFTDYSTNVMPGASYSWDFNNDGIIDDTTQGNTSHVYSMNGAYQVKLVITQACGEKDSSIYIVQITPPVIFIGNDTVLCTGDSVVLNTGPQPGTILWSTGAVTPSITVKNSGIYWVNIDYSSGCQAQDSINVSFQPKPILMINNDTSICQGSVTLMASGAANYLWSPAGSLNNPNIANPIATPGITTTYTVTANDTSGCSVKDSVTITLLSPPIVDAGANIMSCKGDSVQLQATGGANYSWIPAAGLNDPNISNPIGNPLTSTTYTVIVTDGGGCTDTDSVNVFIPDMTVSNDTSLCMGSSTIITANFFNGINYIWTPSTGLSDPNISNPLASPLSTTTYVVTGFNSLGCADTDSVVIKVWPLINADAGPDTSICLGNSAQLLATGGTYYNWLPASGLSAVNISNPAASPVITTTYTVSAIDLHGCENTDSVRITVIPPINAGNDITLCLGQSAVLNASPAGSYLWSNGDTTQSITVSPDSTTTYSVTDPFAFCSENVDSIRVIVENNFPTADFTADPDIGWQPLTVNFTNHSSNANYYLWLLGVDSTGTNETSPVFTYLDEGKYKVQLIAFNSAGCSDTVIKYIIVDNGMGLFIPSAFTPNTDGKNEGFKIGGWGIRSFDILIFDRWGTRIFESKDKSFQWDGNYLGKNVPEGVYTYLIKVSGYSGNTLNRSGTITLIR